MVKKQPTKKRWYEILMARTPSWRPAVEDIRLENYEPSETFVPGAELIPTDSLLDVVLFIMGLDLDGKGRRLTMFDIIHLCQREEKDGQSLFGTTELLLVPRERIREFKGLGLHAPKADSRMPDFCVVTLQESFRQSFKFPQKPK